MSFLVLLLLPLGLTSVTSSCVELAGVEAREIVKRNAIPATLSLLAAMLVL